MLTKIQEADENKIHPPTSLLTKSWPDEILATLQHFGRRQKSWPAEILAEAPPR
jgi:hypothetical protein